MVCYLLRDPLPHAVVQDHFPFALLPSLLPFGMTLARIKEETSTTVKQMILSCCNFIIHA